jgi:hypothetical protein
MNVMHCMNNFTPPLFMGPSGLSPSKFLTTFYGFDRNTFVTKYFMFSALLGA